MDAQLIEELNAWAGSRDRRAAVYLLAHALGGRFLQRAVRTRDEPDPFTGGTRYIDAQRVAPSGVESGAEQRILSLASSLLTGEPVDMSWATGNLDDENAAVVTSAIAIATGATAHVSGPMQS